MSLSSPEISGKRGISSERCVQQKSTEKMELECVVVVLQQGGPFESVVVSLINIISNRDIYVLIRIRDE